MQEENVLEVKELVKVYRRGNILANDHINLTVKKGECVGILGPNGSGKTTFVRQIISFLPKTSGEIVLFKTTYEKDAYGIQKKLGYMMQNRFNHWDHLTVQQAFMYAGVLKKMNKSEIKQQSEGLMERFDVTGYRKTMIRRLSGGNKQAVCVALVLMGKPQLVILDEPSVGLDPIKRKMFWKTLKSINEENGVSILIISHNPQEVEKVAHRVVIFNEGKILEQGTIGELKSKFAGRVRMELLLKEDKPKDYLLNIPSKYKILWEENKMIFYCDKSDLPKIMKIFVDINIWKDCEDFEIINPTIEDIYIHAVGKKLD